MDPALRKVFLQSATADSGGALLVFRWQGARLGMLGDFLSHLINLDNSPFTSDNPSF